MNEGTITKFKLDPANPPASTSDWARVDAMTDEEIHQAALDDPDNPPLTEEQLKRLKRRNPKPVREKLAMTQEEFARTFHLSLATLRDWEQNRYQPDQAARTLLRVIEKDPDAVIRALNS